MQAEQFKIIEKQACLSYKRLVHYSTGRISKREKSIIENHLLDCEKCIGVLQEVLNRKDIVEANRIFSQLFEEPFKIKKLNKNPDGTHFGFEIIKRARRFIILTIIVSAGAFILFKILYPVISKQKDAFNLNENSQPTLSSTIQKENRDSKTADEKKAPAEIVDPPKPIHVSKSEPNYSSEQKPEGIKNNIDPVVSSNPLQKIPDKNLVNNKSVSEIKEPVINSSSSKTDPGERFVNNSATVAEPIYVNNYKISLKSIELSGNHDIEQYKNKLAEILKLVDQSQYTDALSGIQKLLYNLPTDINARYYRGYIYYLKEDNEKSRADFEVILDDHNKTFYEDARWYKILLLNRESKFDESKKMLNEVISENGSYRRKAQQLLDLITGK